MRILSDIWDRNKNELTGRAFLAVLAAKLVTGGFCGSEYFLKDRFLAFVRYFIDSGFSDPWVEFMRRGVADAFPYSSVMLAALALPQALFAPFFGGAGNIPDFLAMMLMRLPMLAADVAVFLFLCRWFETRSGHVLWLYWCSPILFYISYVHGQIDVIPTAFLFASIWYALRVSPWWAGAFLGAGLATKFHLAIAAPLIGFYMFKAVRPTERHKVVRAYLVALGAVTAALIGPLLLSEGYRSLVLGAKEMSWVSNMVIPMTRGVNLWICPAVVLALVLHFFSYRAITRDILILYTGLVYSVLLVLVYPMPGWAFWAVPFICYFLVRQQLTNYLPYWLYTAGYLGYHLGFEPMTAVLGLEGVLPPETFVKGRDASFTVMQTSLVLAAVWIYRIGVRGYVRYKASRKPLGIGIGGDSGAGKNTLAEALVAVTGAEHTILLHGDDYHRWERGDKAWEETTHLDPGSNYFSEPTQHVSLLKTGSAIMRRTYDHSTGKFTEPARLEPNRVILFEGLHPLVFKRMRDVFDIKVFIATEEKLRRYWKVLRDCGERGYQAGDVLKEIERRQEDSDKFIKPQAKFADWVIEYEPVGGTPEPTGKESDFGLRVRHTVSSDVVEVEELIEELRARDGIKVSWAMDSSLDRQVLEVEGSLSAEDVRAAAYRIFPDLEELLLVEPEWMSGVLGMNQLVFLTLYRWTVNR